MSKTVAAWALMAVCGSAALAQPSFTGIGFLPGSGPLDTSWVDAVSPDGSVVVGRADKPDTIFTESARWTRAGGLQGMGLPSGIIFSTGTGASVGGSFICGYHESFGERYRPYRWSSAAGAYQDLGLVPGFADSYALDISRDGKTVVGFGNSSLGANGMGFIWREGVGMITMGDLPGGAVGSEALGVSGDGKIVVGASVDAADDRPVMWREGAGLTVLPDLPGGTTFGVATAASNDGRFIVGRSVDGAGYEAVMWKDFGATAVSLGDLPGGPVISIAMGVTDDGSMAVGYSNATAGERGFIWDAAHGIRDAKTVLQTGYGLNLTGWTIGRVNGISADGTVLTGDGTDPRGNFQGWVAVIPSPGTGVVLMSLLPMSARRRR